LEEFFLEDVLEMSGHVIERGTFGGKKKIQGHQGMKQTAGYHGVHESGLAVKKDAKQHGVYSPQTIKSIEAHDEDQINYKLFESTVAYINDHCGPGAILIFLPGLMEITTLYEMLNTSCPKEKFKILPLHSSLSTDDQRRIFVRRHIPPTTVLTSTITLNHDWRPPPGVRKVVIATNIAETSITIDDIAFVIDAGRVKENQYDPITQMPALVEAWESKANAHQRRGRAGRVQKGQAFFMFTRARHAEMAAYQTPEILRVPLSEQCLQIKVLELGTH